MNKTLNYIIKFVTSRPLPLFTISLLFKIVIQVRYPPTFSAEFTKSSVFLQASLRFNFHHEALGIGCAVIYGLGPQFQKLQDYQNTGDYTPAPKAARAFYNGLHRLAWSGVLSWVIFACTKGLGGPVDIFLSWRAWAPLARMSYCIYLVHIVTI